MIKKINNFHFNHFNLRRKEEPAVSPVTLAKEAASRYA